MRERKESLPPETRATACGREAGSGGGGGGAADMMSMEGWMVGLLSRLESDVELGINSQIHAVHSSDTHKCSQSVDQYNDSSILIS